VSHAQDRNDSGRSESARSHIRVHHPSDVRKIQHSQSVQFLSYR